MIPLYVRRHLWANSFLIILFIGCHQQARQAPLPVEIRYPDETRCEFLLQFIHSTQLKMNTRARHISLRHRQMKCREKAYKRRTRAAAPPAEDKQLDECANRFLHPSPALVEEGQSESVTAKIIMIAIFL